MAPYIGTRRESLEIPQLNSWHQNLARLEESHVMNSQMVGH